MLEGSRLFPAMRNRLYEHGADTDGHVSIICGKDLRPVHPRNEADELAKTGSSSNLDTADSAKSAAFSGPTSLILNGGSVGVVSSAVRRINFAMPDVDSDRSQRGKQFISSTGPAHGASAIVISKRNKALAT